MELPRFVNWLYYNNLFFVAESSHVMWLLVQVDHHLSKSRNKIVILYVLTAERHKTCHLP